MSARQLSHRISTRRCLQKTSTIKGLRMTSKVIATFRTTCVIVPSQQESPWSCVSPWRLPQPPGFYMRPPWGRRNVTRSLASQESTCGEAVQGDGWQRGLLDLCVHHGEPCPCLISLQALKRRKVHQHLLVISWFHHKETVSRGYKCQKRVWLYIPCFFFSVRDNIFLLN
jgi:hypothetical protein